MNIVTETVDYRDGDAVLEGFLAYDRDRERPAPTVLIGHMWGGRVEFVCRKAEQLAALGYTAFALDVYGKGVFGADVEENKKLVRPFFDDRVMLQQRLLTALNTARELEPVDPGRMAVVGYCFGGLCALDLARTGAELRGAVSIHGLLQPPDNLGADRIRSKVLILHGSRDPMADMDSLLALQDELSGAGVDWQTVIYGGAQHAFTNPAAANHEMGTVYHPASSRRAWRAMLDFLHEVLD